ncbi:uncharacterized protein RCC_06094 [Ramularia collo-cygni]|uniref:Uncharacterized protein n=1 Tax=Ramularia collo-cygni TaxID=112498 RepID=A0A2D3V6A4_9PEZI|nr:uncharacterized protein RCC_06094 [Ramularia collo-cygni]CZT20237.1 uncharacterized protein RCC_06094 [Ramularia collo-cygni]
MSDSNAIHLAILIDNKTIPTYEGIDAFSKYIRFYPSANFALHVFFPSDFKWLADILLLNVSINGNSASSFHIRPKGEGQELEGIIRSPAFVLPSEPHDHGQIVARMWHAKVSPTEDSLSSSTQPAEKEMENVVDASSLNSKVVSTTPIENSSQHSLTFKWSFRSLDALREIVPSARSQAGPVWTEEDERYHRRQLESGGDREVEQDDYMLRRAEADDKRLSVTEDGNGGDE